MIDLRSDFCARADRRDVGGDARGRARLGDLRRRRERHRAGAPRRGAARQGGAPSSCRRARCEPGRAARAHRAGRPGRDRPGRTSSSTRATGSARSRGWRSASRRPSLPREHAHAPRRTVLTPRRRRARAAGAAPHLDGARLADAAVALGVPLAAARRALAPSRSASARACRRRQGRPRRRRRDDRYRPRPPASWRRRCTRRALAAAGLVALDLVDRPAEDPPREDSRADRRRRAGDELVYADLGPGALEGLAAVVSSRSNSRTDRFATHG